MHRSLESFVSDEKILDGNAKKNKTNKKKKNWKEKELRARAFTSIAQLQTGGRTKEEKK